MGAHELREGPSEGLQVRQHGALVAKLVEGALLVVGQAALQSIAGCPRTGHGGRLLMAALARRSVCRQPLSKQAEKAKEGAANPKKS